MMKKALGTYNPNTFTITLSKDYHMFDENLNVKEGVTSEIHAVFLHELWHCWINLSTLTGFRDFISYFTDIAYTSQRVRNFNVIDPLLEDDMQKMIFYRKLLNGDFNWCNTYKTPIKKIEIHDAGLTEERDNFCFNYKEVSIEFQESKLNLGNFVIDESTTKETELFICKKPYNKSEFNESYMPYNLFNELDEYYKCSKLNIERVLIGMMALNTLQPSKTIIRIYEKYSNESFKNKSIDEVCSFYKRIWDNDYKSDFDKIILFSDEEMKDIIEISKDREKLTESVNYIMEIYSNMLSKRKENIFWDIDRILEYNNSQAIAFIPGNIEMQFNAIQEHEGDENKILRDEVFQITPSTQENIFEYYKILECLIHYSKSQLHETEDKKCPLYTYCNLMKRKENGYYCKNEPWKIIDKKDSKNSELCAYEYAIKAVGNQ